MTTLTANEQAAINWIARNNCACGDRATKSYLRDDNMTWFSGEGLAKGLGVSFQSAGGTMSSLEAKGLVQNYDETQEFGWILTASGIDACDLGEA